MQCPRLVPNLPHSLAYHPFLPEGFEWVCFLWSVWEHPCVTNTLLKEHDMTSTQKRALCTIKDQLCPALKPHRLVLYIWASCKKRTIWILLCKDCVYEGHPCCSLFVFISMYYSTVLRYCWSSFYSGCLGICFLFWPITRNAFRNIFTCLLGSYGYFLLCVHLGMALRLFFKGFCQTVCQSAYIHLKYFNMDLSFSFKYY